MSRNAQKSASNKFINRTASVIAGLIFVLLSSCMPDATDPALSESPRRTNTGGPAGASDDTQFGDSQFGNSYGNPNSNSGNSTGNTNSNSYGTANNGNNGSNSANNGSNGAINNANNSNNMINSNSDCYKADEFVCKVERLIGEKTNKYREGRGLQPLALDAKIAFVSRDWSKKQASSGFISHSGFPSSRVSVYRQEFNVSRSLRGENVAMTGRVSSMTQDDAAAERVAQEFAVMWWNSSGHRANMLGRFKSLGVGVYKNSRGSWYATQIFE